MFYFDLLTIIYFFKVNFVFGYLNINELSSFQYEIDILNNPRLSDNFLHENEQTVLLSSKYGQKYECTVDQPRQEQSEDNANDIRSIVELLKPLEDGPCLQIVTGWWTYEFCYKKYIRQYHQSEDKAIVGDIIYLGYFESEFNWNTSLTKQKEFTDGFHSQVYSNGSYCDLTQRMRYTDVKIMCRASSTESAMDAVTVVDEPSTCRYVLVVESSRICGHPLMRRKPKMETYGILCNPLLNQEQYNEYVETEKLKTAKKPTLDKQSNVDMEEEEEGDDSEESSMLMTSESDEMQMLARIMVKIGGGKEVKFALTDENTDNTESSAVDNFDDQKITFTDGPDKDGSAASSGLSDPSESKESNFNLKESIPDKDDGSFTMLDEINIEEMTLLENLPDMINSGYNKVEPESDSVGDTSQQLAEVEVDKKDLFEANANLDKNIISEEKEEKNENSNDIVLKEDNENNELETKVEETDGTQEVEKKLENRQDPITEARHFTDKDFKDGKVQWEVGQNQNQEITISANSVKISKKLGKKKFVDINDLPFSIRLISKDNAEGESNEPTLFAIVTRSNVDEKREKKRIQRIEANYQYVYQSDKKENK